MPESMLALIQFSVLGSFFIGMILGGVIVGHMVHSSNKDGE